uniref:Uncharacterized protein n=1 Tax=Araucaria cunninghamii TaxID=56994 RepID=A0A0D6R5P0_ARACU
MAQLGSALLSSIFGTLSHPIFQGRSNSGSPGSNQPPSSPFESEMLTRMESLIRAGESAATHLDLKWLREALAAVLAAHVAVGAAIPAARKAPALLSDKDAKSVNDYLDDSVKLLDVCNALKESFADVERYQMLVQLALHSLDTGESMNEKKLIRTKAVLNECIEAMKKKDEELDRQGQQRSRLETCSSMLRRMGEKFTTVTPDGSELLSAMCGAKAVTVFVCGVLAAALLVKPRRPLPSLHVTGPCWAPALLRLQSRVKDEVEKRKARGSNSALLQELDCVHSEVKRLHGILHKMLGDKGVSKMDEVRESVVTLQRVSEELQKGMGPLENQIKELYKMLVSTRVALLGVLSHSRN